MGDLPDAPGILASEKLGGEEAEVLCRFFLFHILVRIPCPPAWMVGLERLRAAEVGSASLNLCLAQSLYLFYFLRQGLTVALSAVQWCYLSSLQAPPPKFK